MNGFQILSLVSAILGLVTTVGMTVSGWIVSGERAKRARVETKLEDLQSEVNSMKIEMARDYVRSPQMESVLQQIRAEMGAVNQNVATALGEIHKLALRVSEIHGMQGAVTNGSARRDG
jgi:chromosome segregation ATPase